MIVLSWNCRGLGNPQAVRSLCRMVKTKKPNLVFLTETKVSLVDCRGKTGGLILLWKSPCVVDIQNYSCNHINAVIKTSCDPWKFSGFYGYPEVAKRHYSWTLLRHLASLIPVPWLCLGTSMRYCLWGENPAGVTALKFRWPEAFQHALDDCNLLDLKFSVVYNFPIISCLTEILY